MPPSLSWLLHIPLQLPCGTISTTPAWTALALLLSPSPLDWRLIVVCPKCYCYFFNCRSSRISYFNAKTLGVSSKKHSRWSSVTLLPSTAMLPLGWRSNAIVAAFPLCSLDNLTFVSAAAKARCLLLSWQHFCLGSFLLKKAATMPSLCDAHCQGCSQKQFPLRCHLPYVVASRQCCCCGWHLLIVDYHFCLLPGHLFFKKAAVTPPLCCDAVKVVAKSDSLSAVNCDDAATFQHAAADALLIGCLSFLVADFGCCQNLLQKWLLQHRDCATTLLRRFNISIAPFAGASSHHHWWLYLWHRRLLGPSLVPVPLSTIVGACTFTIVVGA